MKSVKEPGIYLMWKGELVKVISYAEGKTIYMQPVGAKPCERCGNITEHGVLEHSPLFQENAEPVETLNSNL